MENQKWWLIGSLAVLGSFGLYHVLGNRRKTTEKKIKPPIKKKEIHPTQKDPMDYETIIVILKQVQRDVNLHLGQIYLNFHKVKNHFIANQLPFDSREISNILKQSLCFKDYERFLEKRFQKYVEQQGLTYEEFVRLTSEIYNFKKDDKVMQELDELKFAIQEVSEGILTPKQYDIQIIERTQFIELMKQYQNRVLYQQWEFLDQLIKAQNISTITNVEKEQLAKVQQIITLNVLFQLLETEGFNQTEIPSHLIFEYSLAQHLEKNQEGFKTFVDQLLSKESKILKYILENPSFQENYMQIFDQI